MYFEILCTEHVLYSNNEAPQRHESLAKHGDKEDGILYTSTFSNEKSYCRDVPTVLICYFVANAIDPYTFP